MNNMKYIILIFTVFTGITLNAQTFVDALRYSQFDFGGSARYQGTGGAMTALGADFTSMSTNPAGLAVFRKSELMVTPWVVGTNTTSTLQGAGNLSNTEEALNFKLGNAGLVIASNPGGKWTTVNFGIGLNRTADYQQEFYFNGRANGSIVDRFTAVADGFQLDELDDFEGGLAYDAAAIYGPDADGFYFSDMNSNANQNYFLTKSQFARQTGYSNELSFGLAGNYNEKLLIGVSLNVPFVRFTSNKEYIEEDPGNEVTNFNYLSFEEQLTASGSGFNAKLGLIYQPIHEVRIGASVHTPSYLKFTEAFTNSLTYSYTEESNPPSVATANSPEGFFEYRLRTPWRYSGGIGTIIKSFGFISADVEYVDYGSTSFKFVSSNIADIEYQRELNETVDTRLQGALNLRLGAELALDIWRIRGGYMMYGSPYEGDSKFNTGFSLGAGFRANKFYIDLAYVRRGFDQIYQVYQIDDVNKPNVDQDIVRSNVVLTVGFKI
jgi:hypothetical protein